MNNKLVEIICAEGVTISGGWLWRIQTQHAILLARKSRPTRALALKAGVKCAKAFGLIEKGVDYRECEAE